MALCLNKLLLGLIRFCSCGAVRHFETCWWEPEEERGVASAEVVNKCREFPQMGSCIKLALTLSFSPSNSAFIIHLKVSLLVFYPASFMHQRYKIQLTHTLCCYSTIYVIFNYISPVTEQISCLIQPVDSTKSCMPDLSSAFCTKYWRFIVLPPVSTRL